MRDCRDDDLGARVRAVVQRLTEPGESAATGQPLRGHDSALLGGDRAAVLKRLQQAVAGHAQGLQDAFAAVATQVAILATVFSELPDLARAGEAVPSPD